MEPEILYSLKQAEDFGFSEASDAASGLLHYENIKEFFRENPNGELHVVATASTVTVDTMLGNNTTPGTIEPFIIAQGGRIKQLAIMADEADSNWFEDNLVANDYVSKAQAFCDRLSKNHMPLDVVFLEGHGFNATPADALDLRTKNASNVAVVIGGDYDVSSLMTSIDGQGYASIGTVLGSSTKKAVHESIAWAKPENSITSEVGNRFLKVRYVSDMTVGDPYASNPDLLEVLHNKGYIFPRRVPYLSGYFWNQSNNCVPVSNDIDSIELMQVMNKAIRLTGEVITPYLNRSYNLTSTGRLTALQRQTIVAEIRTKLETNMANNISAISTIVVDPDTDDNNAPYLSLVVDKTLRVRLGLQPKGKTEQVIFSAGYQATA
jgi:hypothetical protein